MIVETFALLVLVSIAAIALRSRNVRLNSILAAVLAIDFKH